MKYIPYSRQLIDKKDSKLVLSSLSNDLITTGPFVEKFENNLKKYLKCKFSYVCSSGTAAIHLAMLSLNLKKNDIILMPAINFIASYNMAKTMGLKVYLVDVDELNGQITPNKILECIEKNNLKKINALIVMFHGGYPENIKKFYDIKQKYKFFIIEDACHALGAEYKFKKNFFKIGSCKHADISTFSLHPLKTITSGEGGIITTNNSKIAKNIKLFRSHGISRNKKIHWLYDIKKHGFNYRLSDLNCALGLSQLRKINFFLKKRKKIYTKYLNELKKLHLNLKIPEYSKSIKPSYHLFTINILFDKFNMNKDHFMKYLLNNKIITQQHYIPIYKFSIYNEKKKSFPASEKYINNSVSIPIYVGLDKKKQERIIKIIKRYFINKKK
ncbi:aminotransferase class I/II-fold pyridoxal phosphate-dependent enzyme [Candidatus Pelagibacter bacterium nBUS_28]|jgi:dTDP-4-amino-4,6-dideoxygalactose transaminase|uniref:aminotransferase class I/II-fold pyridoxal phosphate-dependent enzyme n=1 Tax=Candidatus Pelagibacter bacterium nBUS_28 TaxID=3374189 RepID=UPI003EC07AA6